MRVFNFAAGPATLPLEVLQQVQAEMTDWKSSGMSVMEVSHRSKAFIAVAQEAEADLRELLGIPANYKVLFLQGGATGMFSAIPMNLATADSTVDYVNTGAWSKKAIGEAKRFCKVVNVSADEAASNYSTVPAQGALKLTPNAAYFHYTPNETIGGVEFDYVPQTNGVPLVADFSSTILSRPIDVSKFGLIYAGAQKNIGPSGLVVVIVRDDLIGKARPGTPSVWDFKAMADEASMLNTPPTFGFYFAGLVFKWLKKQGGLKAMEERNRTKAAKLYDFIEGSGFYKSPVAKNARSWMNVPFTLAKPDLDKTFCAEAGKVGLVNLEGHRSVGGMRASIYNAMPPEGIDALIQFMKDFQQRNT
jgi:phosphoserine aminotransferase